MKRISLHIKAHDILTTDYRDSNDCAITRALDRAGYPQLRHEGTDITHTVSRETIVNLNNKSLDELTNLVWNMYDAKEEKNFEAVEDIHFTLKY